MTPAEKQKVSQNKLYDLAKQFFGFGDDPGRIKIILPSVSRLRKITLKCSNYPLHDYDVSPDDVLSAMRVHSLLTAIYGGKTVEVFFQRDLTILPDDNLILIGGPPTNSLTSGRLEDCPINFGADKANRIIHSPPKNYEVEFSDEPAKKGQSPAITKDYCLISKKRENHNIGFVIAGLRAYGQAATSDFLGREKFYRQVQDVSQADNFQIVVEISVEGTTFVKWKVVEKRSWPSPDSGNHKEVEISEILQKHNLLYLEDFAVVGNFVRYDEKQRNKLKDYYRNIARAIKGTTIALENYIFWGPPSAGKTMLVKETARILQKDLKSTRFVYHPFNLSKMTQAELSQNLQDVAGEAKETNLLCLVDEVDAKIDERWPFEMLVSSLELNTSSKATVVWVLAGSSGKNLEGFLGQLKGCYKGKDVVSRIPYVMPLPPQEVGDRLLVCLSEIDMRSKRQIRFIEKFALLYLVVSKELDSLRQLSERIGRAVSRVGTDDDRLRYDHLFEAGDNTGREFWTEHRESASKFMDSYLQFARKR